VGVVLGVRARDPFVAVPLVIHVALTTAHAITYMDTLYYYVKVPFVMVLGFYGIGRLGRAAGPAAVAVAAFALALSVYTLFL
jgi:hypothetical protein